MPCIWVPCFCFCTGQISVPLLLTYTLVILFCFSTARALLPCTFSFVPCLSRTQMMLPVHLTYVSLALWSFHSLPFPGRSSFLSTGWPSFPYMCPVRFFSSGAAPFSFCLCLAFAAYLRSFQVVFPFAFFFPSRSLPLPFQGVCSRLLLPSFLSCINKFLEIIRSIFRPYSRDLRRFRLVYGKLFILRTSMTSCPSCDRVFSPSSGATRHTSYVLPFLLSPIFAVISCHTTCVMRQVTYSYPFTTSAVIHHLDIYVFLPPLLIHFGGRRHRPVLRGMTRSTSSSEGACVVVETRP